MKRFIPVLILLAFLLQLADGRLARACITPQFSPYSQEDSTLSAYLPADLFLDQWDAAEQASGPAGNLIFLPGPFRKNPAPFPWVIPSSLKHFIWLGLGSGALPS